MSNNKPLYVAIALGLCVAVNVEAAGLDRSDRTLTSGKDEMIDTQYTPSTTSTSTSTYTTTQPAGSDQALARQIQDRINSAWLSKSYSAVTAKVINGVVTLDGTVNTRDQKAKIAEEVSNIPGVKSVDNQIMVKEDNKFPQDRATNTGDEKINKAIRDKISNSWFRNNHKDIALNTTNGVVTLDGTIKNLSDQQKIIAEIERIPGIKSVVNNLKIIK